MVEQQHEWLRDLPQCERFLLGDPGNAERSADAADLFALAARWCEEHRGRIVRDAVVNLYDGIVTLYVEVQDGGSSPTG